MSRLAASLVTVLLLSSAAFAQVAPPREARAQPPVLFFTDEIISLAVDRIADEMGRHYKFEDYQLDIAREEMQQRFPAFMSENREELVVLFNDYMAALLGADPPSPEAVADWSQRFQPKLNEFVNLIEETTGAIRPILNDDQQIQLDGEMAAMRVGLGAMNNRLMVWSQGGYDWQSEWPRSESFREEEEKRRLAVERAQKVAELTARGEPIPPELLEPPAQPNQPAIQPAVSVSGTTPETRPAPSVRKKDDWDVYVEQFIARYQLDEAQQNTVRKIHDGLRDQRDRYLKRRAPEIEALGNKYDAAKAEAERDRLKAELDRIQAPIDRYFQRLKDKLDEIPSRKQRAEAARREADRPAGSERTPAAPPPPADPNRP